MLAHKINNAYMTTYGITYLEVETMLWRQRNVCAICEEPPKPGKCLCVDHCHKSGKVRGMLCTRCNTGLGWFESENETLMDRWDWLEKYKDAIHNYCFIPDVME